MTQIITVHGGLVATPELKITNSGTPLATFTVASSDRVQNRDTGQWEDGKDKLFLRCTAWGNVGENIAASNLEKGARVVVTGKLLTREWEQDGQRRSQVELKVTDFGVSLKHASASVTKTTSQQRAGGGQQASGQAGWHNPSPDSFGGGTADPGFGGGFEDPEPF